MSDEILRREFPAEIEASGDGRTLEVRIVPYNEPATVRDTPYGEAYQEVFLEGAFDKQLSAPNRVSVFVNVEHEKGIGGIVGRGTELREVPGDGLHGTFRMLNHSDADKALELVKEGDLTGVSLEFQPIKSVREGSLVKREKARLVNMALVRPSGSVDGIQAYKGAGVLAVRTTVEEPPEPEPAPEPAPEPEPDRRGELDDLLTRVGYEPLLKRAVVRTAWDGAASRYDDEQWARACVLDRGSQFDTAKTRYALPVLEPNGDLNVNGMHAAASRLNQVQSSPAAKAAAARKLARLYRQAGEQPPAPMMAMAGRG